MELFDKDAEPVVQSPSPGKFSAETIRWQYLRLSNSPYPVQQVCHVPYDRVQDFVRGEAENPVHPTTFRIYSSRRCRRQSKTSVTSFRTYSEELTYWCVYGPDTKPRKHKKAFDLGDLKKPRPRVTPSPFTKGCGCHFIVHRLVLLPDVARISYVHPHHTNNDDLVCHAVELDRLKLGLGIVAPWLSYEMKSWVLALLCAGFTVQQVFDRHIWALHERRQRSTMYQISRDDFLTPKDVANIAKQLAYIQEEVEDEDALNIRLWYLLNQGDIFFYQEQNKSDNSSFMLGIQSQWQLEMMLKFGNNGLLAMSTTLNTNHFKFHVYTIMVFDQQHSGIPVAWAITSSIRASTTKQWLCELQRRALTLSPEWKPSAFVIDDAFIDVEAIRSLFDLPILLSLWYLRRCWLKHLIQKVKSWGMRAAMFDALGCIMNMPHWPVHGNSQQRLRPANAIMSEFMENFCEQEEFVIYFREHWLKNMEVWIRAARTLGHTNHEINGAMEAFHITLEQHSLKAKHRIFSQRIDWLFHILLTEVVPFFWYQYHLKEGGFGKRAAASAIIESSVMLAMKIPDSDVLYRGGAHFPSLGHVAHVRSQSNRDKWYEVFNAQSGWACCTCDWAIQGNQCKHQVKVMLMEGVPVSSHCIGWVEEDLSIHEALPSEASILDQEVYHEAHISDAFDAQPRPLNGLAEDIQRLQQGTLELAGDNFSLLQRLHDDMVRAQQLLLDARSGSLDMIPQAGPHF